MMDEFIHWPKPYLLLSTNCDEILSWMIEIHMKNHLGCDFNCNTVNLQSFKKFTRNDKKCWVHLVLETLYCNLHLELVILNIIFSVATPIFSNLDPHGNLLLHVTKDGVLNHH